MKKEVWDDGRRKEKIDKENPKVKFKENKIGSRERVKGT